MKWFNSGRDDDAPASAPKSELTPADAAALRGTPCKFWVTKRGGEYGTLLRVHVVKHSAAKRAKPKRPYLADALDGDYDIRPWYVRPAYDGDAKARHNAYAAAGVGAASMALAFLGVPFAAEAAGLEAAGADCAAAAGDGTYQELDLGPVPE